MIPLRIFLFIGLLFPFARFAHAADQQSVLRWGASELVGSTIELVSDTHIEWMHFNADGSLPITIGTKGGWVAGPIFTWHIDSNGVLVIIDNRGHEFKAMRKVSIDKNSVIVDVDGSPVTYKRLE